MARLFPNLPEQAIVIAGDLARESLELPRDFEHVRWDFFWQAGQTGPRSAQYPRAYHCAGAGFSGCPERKYREADNLSTAGAILELFLQELDNPIAER